jgi:hypothetical protein
MENIKTNFPVQGQSLEIQFCIDEFMKQAIEEESLFRQSLREQVRSVVY